MSKRKTWDDVKSRFECEVAAYVAAHPEVPLRAVGEVFGIDRRELYAIRKRRGLSLRPQAGLGTRRKKETT